MRKLYLSILFGLVGILYIDLPVIIRRRRRAINRAEFREPEFEEPWE